jgi:DNA-binding Xre family transcriptional regulator
VLWRPCPQRSGPPPKPRSRDPWHSARRPTAKRKRRRSSARSARSFPPLLIDPELAKALSALRAECERQGLSLSEVSERTGIDLATLSMIETGKVTNPTFGTLRALAHALNKQLSWSLVDEPAGAGR